MTKSYYKMFFLLLFFLHENIICRSFFTPVLHFLIRLLSILLDHQSGNINPLLVPGVYLYLCAHKERKYRRISNKRETLPESYIWFQHSPFVWAKRRGFLERPINLVVMFFLECGRMLEYLQTAGRIQTTWRKSQDLDLKPGPSYWKVKLLLNCPPSSSRSLAVWTKCKCIIYRSLV